MNEKYSNWLRNKRYRWLAIGGLAVVGVAVGAGFVKKNTASPLMDQPVTTVERGPLTISVIESGTIRPRQQLILRNEMDEDANILFIVPEGSLVKKDDLLVELDAGVFENELLERRIRVQNGEAALIYARENFSVVTNQAQADVDQAGLAYEFARQDLEKYLNGEYPKLLMELQAKITLAQEELGQAEEDLRWSKRLFDEKYLSQSDLQQDELAAKKTQLNVQLALEDLSLATNYTHLRQVRQFESDVKQTEMALERARRKAAANIAQAEAEFRAREAEYAEEKARLLRVESEIVKAKIRAPIDGMVLYASSVSRNRWDEQVRIEEGAMIHERREIIYLPTADSFNVDIRIPEVNLTKIRPGLVARVTVDALPGKTLWGQVASISPLPDSESRFLNPNLKLYNAVVELDPADVTLRNGMSCEVNVVVDEFPDALYVPIQAVVQVNGQTVVYRVNGSTAEPVPVKLGLDNNRVVQIASGVEAGQTLLLNPPFSQSNTRGKSDNEERPANNGAAGGERKGEAAPAKGKDAAPAEDGGSRRERKGKRDSDGSAPPMDSRNPVEPRAGASVAAASVIGFRQATAAE